MIEGKGKGKERERERQTECPKVKENRCVAESP
jgi:hypothetical protein